MSGEFGMQDRSKNMNIDLITETIALDSSKIIAVNQGDGSIHLTGGISLLVGADTISAVIKELQSRQTSR
jgi:hypothetical protein